MEKKILNIQELSEYIKLKKSKIYSMTHEKKIPHYKLGASLRFDVDIINEW